MHAETLPASSSPLCPDLRHGWKLGKVKNSEQFVLQEIATQRLLQVSPTEAKALQYFTGRYSIAEVEEKVKSGVVNHLVNKIINSQFAIRNSQLLNNSQFAIRNSQLSDNLRLDEEQEGNYQASTDDDSFSSLQGKKTAAQGHPTFPISGNGSKVELNLTSANPRLTSNHQHTSDTAQPNQNCEQTYPNEQTNPNPEQSSSSEFSNPNCELRIGNCELLKSSIQWFPHPDGHWILRNGEDFTFLQVNEMGKAVTDDLARMPPAAVVQKHGISPGEVQQYLGLLGATGMLVGTKPKKPKKGKFTPLDLLFFLWPLLNPDAWLSVHLGKVRWLFHRISAFFLLTFLGLCWVVGLSQRSAIAVFGMQLWQGSGGSLILPFILLSLTVVSLHELAHAFTLKHYGGIVPEMGLMFMALFPAAYTDTTDSYCLTRRRQRVLVVAAGVLCQLTLAAVALSLWNITVRGSWLHTCSYLLMVASLVTVALNLNPLAKFDGYYLAVAASGINNLRSRAFLFYIKLFTGHPIEEKPTDAWILALYAPFSLAYLWFVFGFLFCRLGDWILTNIPFLALTLLAAWGIYYFFPSEK